jgi:hypothetical protein
VNLGDHLVGVCRDDGERADPLAALSSPPASRQQDYALHVH